MLLLVACGLSPSPAPSSPRVTPPPESTIGPESNGSNSATGNSNATGTGTASSNSGSPISALTGGGGGGSGGSSDGGEFSSVPTLAPAPAVTPTPALGRQTQDPTAVVVFAATALGPVLTELGGNFMLAEPDATGVSYRLDNSATLRGLIQQGAAADVFISIDQSVMDTLQQANLLDGSPSVLASDQLAIVTSQANPQHLQSLSDLATDGVRFIIPAPTSPTSTALMAAFDAASHDPTYGADFGTKADRNVLARDGDDHLVISRIIAGEVSAGVVYASSIDPSSRKQLQVIMLPDAVSRPVQYPIAALKNASNARGAEAFVKYATSAQAQGILSKYGFSNAGAGAVNAAR